MQVNPITDNKQKPAAMQMLEFALEELNGQLIGEDFDKIAKKARISKRTVIRYTREKSVRHFATGKKILDIGRAVVVKREQSISTAA